MAYENLTPDQRRQLNELLSQTTIRSDGTIDGQPNGMLSDLMTPQQVQPQPLTMSQRLGMREDNTEPGVSYGADLPQNFIRNNSTGAVTSMDNAIAPSGPVLDYAQPIEYGGMGKGYRVKGDPFSAVINGQKVSLGQDTAATRARQKEDLALEKTRAEITNLQAKPSKDTGTWKEVESGGKMYRINNKSGAIEPLLMGTEQLVGKAKEEKAVPASAAKGILSNRDNLRKAQTALSLLSGETVDNMAGDKEATGWKGYAPEAVLQRTDPTGINTRAAIGDIGSMVIHDRSGAAVTASEFPRLRPFIPLVTDDPETARKKLNRFVSEYSNLVDDTESFYADSGYKVPKGKTHSPAAPTTSTPRYKLKSPGLDPKLKSSYVEY